MSTEPTGLGPSALVTSSHYPPRRMLLWNPGSGEVPSQATLMALPPGAEVGCRMHVGTWLLGSIVTQDSVHSGQPVFPSCLPGMPPNSTSAPGVPGGSATAKAVAPLPGAVDEAQGIFELLPAGGFVDCLMGEVHLVDGFPPGVQCR